MFLSRRLGLGLDLSIEPFGLGLSLSLIMSGLINIAVDL